MHQTLLGLPIRTDKDRRILNVACGQQGLAKGLNMALL
jgi:hypothetical protein